MGCGHRVLEVGAGRKLGKSVTVPSAIRNSIGESFILARLGESRSRSRSVRIRLNGWAGPSHPYVRPGEQALASFTRSPELEKHRGKWAHLSTQLVSSLMNSRILLTDFNGGITEIVECKALNSMIVGSNLYQDLNLFGLSWV